MNKEQIIDCLNEILLQFEMNVTEAEMGEADALEAEQSNRESVEALKHAIKLEERELLSEWIKLSDDFPKSRGNYWVTLKHRDGSLSVEKFKFDWDELVIDAWKETVIAWQPYYCPEVYKED